jgi:hypothetical protein
MEDLKITTTNDVVGQRHPSRVPSNIINIGTPV